MVSTAFAVKANPTNDTTTTKIDTTEWITLNKSLWALDSLLYTPFFEKESHIYQYDTNLYTDVPKMPEKPISFGDSIYKAKLQQLDSLTPVNLVFNKRVKAFIHLYAVKRRTQTAKMIGMQYQYFPMVEEIMDLYDIPVEIKYLAIVESALNPKARSRAGAVGLWQFMYSTGKLYGLHQNSYMDERMDPIKSTHAACKYLKYLYKIYGKWDLVLAAYNCGPGNVNRALRRSGTKTGNYWDIYSYLPRETRGYVPAFIAVNYIMNNYEAHQIVPVSPKITFFETDTLVIKKPMRFDYLAKWLSVPVSELRFLNPSYKRDYIPAYSNKSNFLCLPNEKIALFLDNEDTLYASIVDKKVNDGTKLPAFKQDRTIHRVRKGEYLGKIANRYRVSVRSLKRWNGLRSNNLRIGQKLVIYPSGSYRASKSKPSKKLNLTKSGNYVYYEIQRGDTLWEISRARGVSVTQLKNWNKSINSSDLKVGTKIIVGTNG